MAEHVTKTGFDDFLDILVKFRTLSVAALGGGAAVPFVAYAAKIAPPWPPGILLLTALAQLVCLILTFQFLRTKGRKIINKVIGTTVAVLFAASLIYLTLFSIFTYITPHTGERWVKGFICRNDILQLYREECPLVGRDALSDAQWTAENIWQEWSVDLMKVIISVNWLVCFVFLSVAIGSFLVFQTRIPKKVARGSTAPKPQDGL